jgi:hypothetical protein
MPVHEAMERTSRVQDILVEDGIWMNGGQKRLRWKGREFRTVEHKMVVEGSEKNSSRRKNI